MVVLLAVHFFDSDMFKSDPRGALIATMLLAEVAFVSFITRK
jgi:hypothetical protein